MGDDLTACRRKSQTVKSSTPATNRLTTSAYYQRRARAVRHRAGDSVAQAQQRAYQLLTDICWDGSFSRSDIGWRAIERKG
ncbi:hypothetical protein MJ584_01915 [Klebsiella pneumoniae]|nr:hypothetical protein MJ584_01915 [Klebsiella pneumoniae]